MRAPTRLQIEDRRFVILIRRQTTEGSYSDNLIITHPLRKSKGGRLRNDTAEKTIKSPNPNLKTNRLM